MSVKHLFISAVLLLSGAIHADPLKMETFRQARLIPHLPSDAPSEVYREFLNGRRSPFRTGPFITTVDAEIDANIRMGEIFLDWLELINAQRAEDQKIRLYNPDNMRAYPIDSPSKYSPSIIARTKTALMAQLPTEIKSVIQGQRRPTATIQMNDEDFAEWGRQVDRLYQTSSRWKLMSPNLFYYRMLKTEDIRGFYFLTHTANIETVLSGWSSLSAADKNQYKIWLLGMCMNDGAESTCTRNLNNAIQANTVAAFYRQNLPKGQSKWDANFQLGARRSDINWNSRSPNVLSFPFRTPPAMSYQNWLKTNIEDEWRMGTWSLVLNFTPNAATHVEFEPGVTPHVNGLGGSIITMDENTSLEEWDTQWTIRHEFGHVLGFPDCYVEFYDDNEQAMINYQLDITNLMCSRRGELQQKHVDELRRVYYRP